MAFETVFDKGEHADFCLIKYNQPQDKTYKELQKDYSLYARFKAFRERRIYGWMPSCFLRSRTAEDTVG